MDAKLTLKLDAVIIEKAKAYARETNTSLSKLIENYLSAVVKKNSENKRKVHPIVESLTGVVDLDGSVDYKKSYTKYLKKKYK